MHRPAQAVLGSAVVLWGMGLTAAHCRGGRSGRAAGGWAQSDPGGACAPAGRPGRSGGRAAGRGGGHGRGAGPAAGGGRTRSGRPGRGRAGRSGAGGLLPQTQAYLIGYLALAGLGLRASLRTWAAIAGALAVFAAMNVAYLLVANGSITGLITQDIGLVFIFAFVRATRLAEERARAAHRQAEILLASCGPVRVPVPRRWRWPSAVGWPGRSMTSWPTPFPAWYWRWTQWSC